MTTAPPAWTDDELAAIATELADRSPGVVGLLPVVARRAVSVFRTGSRLAVTVRLVVAVDPAPIETVRVFGRHLQDALQERTGIEVVVELAVADVR